VKDYLKQYLSTHLFYVILIAVTLLFAHSWLAEHDARRAAEATTKVDEANVLDLQRQIGTVNANAQAQLVPIAKITQAAKTPAQVVQAVPQLTDIPLNTRVLASNPNIVGVDPAALIQVVGDLKTSTIQLTACQQTSTLKDEQLKAKDDEIKAWKKKPSFWKRVGSTLKTVLIGAAAGEVFRVAIKGAL
jgi:hypothetical protein